jgi:hypothetical protein
MNLNTINLCSSDISSSQLLKWFESEALAMLHVVYVWSDNTIETEQIDVFQELSKILSGKDLTFVLVSEQLTYDDLPESIFLCPTLEEAHDLIEMEAIQRDLGI